MIKTFKCKETEKVWRGIRSQKLPIDIQERTLRKLRQLNASSCFRDLQMPPSNHLKRLSGIKKDMYSIRINDQWRLCFDWECNESYDVEVIDYH